MSCVIIALFFVKTLRKRTNFEGFGLFRIIRLGFALGLYALFLLPVLLLLLNTDQILQNPVTQGLITHRDNKFVFKIVVKSRILSVIKIMLWTIPLSISLDHSAVEWVHFNSHPMAKLMCGVMTGLFSRKVIENLWFGISFP